MKRLIVIGAVFAILSASQAVTQPTAMAQTSLPGGGQIDQFRGMLTTYCMGCHNSQGRAGGLALDSKKLEAVPEDAEIWEAALRKLRGRLMPPPGSPQPAQKDIDAFTGWIEARLDAGAKGPKAGHVPIQRLNRTEYANAVKDLIGVEVKAKDVLPTDIEIDGFDNIAAALSVSPAFLDQYISAARTAAKLAVGDPAPRVSVVNYPAPGGRQSAYEDGFPFGTRGGMRFKHNFPADGEYRFNILDLDSIGQYTRALETRHTLVLLIDDKVVFRGQIGGLEDLSQADRGGAPGRAKIMARFQNIPTHVNAGVRDVVVTFIERSRAESDDNNTDEDGGLRIPRLLNGVEVAGPFDPTGVTKTPSRSLIFICEPKAEEETACARRITENLARRAFRRPVNADDIARLMPFYEAGRKGSGRFDDGIEQLVVAVLASPDFLYRAIRPPQSAAPNGEFALSDLELASRLSFFIWSQGPDKELLDIAAAGGLSKPGVPGKPDEVVRQVRRMLADPRASSLVTSFAMKWLNLDDLDAVKPDPKLFPDFNEQLRQEFGREAESFIASILLEDRSVMELLTADYTFLNEDLARHYGITSVHGPQFRRVALTNSSRRGLLGKGAVLLRTSYGDRTSPVLRGAWVLEKLMGTPPSPPPPDTATDLSTPQGEKPRTVRARLEQHRDKASCKQCHGVIDPIGLSLENFDAIGQWRDEDREAKAPIDASTVLPNGVAINGPVELEEQLAGRPGMFVQTLTEKLMMYALGRKLEYFDMPQVRAVVGRAAKDNYRWSTIVLGIVNSDAFRKQGPASVTKASGATAAAKN